MLRAGGGGGGAGPGAGGGGGGKPKPPQAGSGTTTTTTTAAAVAAAQEEAQRRQELVALLAETRTEPVDGSPVAPTKAPDMTHVRAACNELKQRMRQQAQEKQKKQGAMDGQEDGAAARRTAGRQKVVRDYLALAAAHGGSAALAAVLAQGAAWEREEKDEAYDRAAAAAEAAATSASRLPLRHAASPSRAPPSYQALVDAPDRNGVPPIVHAAYHHNLEALRFLLDEPAGAKKPLACTRRTGLSALAACCKAAGTGNPEYYPKAVEATVGMLLSRRPKLLTLRDKKQRLPLHHAVASNRVELVILLIQAADSSPLGPEQAFEALTAMDEGGASPLQAAEAFSVLASMGLPPPPPAPSSRRAKARQRRQQQQQQQQQAGGGGSGDAAAGGWPLNEVVEEAMGNGRGTAARGSVRAPSAGGEQEQDGEPALISDESASSLPVRQPAWGGAGAGGSGQQGQGEEEEEEGKASVQSMQSGGPKAGSAAYKDARSYAERYEGLAWRAPTTTTTTTASTNATTTNSSGGRQGARNRWHRRGAGASTSAAAAAASAVKEEELEGDGAILGSPASLDAARATHIMLALAVAVGLPVALSGGGGLRQRAHRHRIIAALGLDYVLGDAFALALYNQDMVEHDHHRNCRTLYLVAQEGKVLPPVSFAGPHGHAPPRLTLAHLLLHRICGGDGTSTAQRNAEWARRRAAPEWGEHSDNIVDEVLAMRRAAMQPQQAGRRRGQQRQQQRAQQREQQSLALALYGEMMAPKPWSAMGGLSTAAMVFAVQRLSDPTAHAPSVYPLVLLLAEALELAKCYVDTAVAEGYRDEDGDPALGQLLPGLIQPGLWMHVLKELGRLGRCLAFGLIGQTEGPGGEILTMREEQHFEALLELVLRVLVPLAPEIDIPGMAATAANNDDGGGGGNDGAASSSSVQQEEDEEDKEEASAAAATAAAKGARAIAVLGGAALGPLWSLLPLAMQSMDGMVEEPSRFAALTRAYLAWLLITDTTPATAARVRAVIAQCAPKPVHVLKPQQQQQARRKPGNPPNALKSLASAVGVTTTSSNNSNNQRRRQRGGQQQQQEEQSPLPVPGPFLAFVKEAAPGLNCVLQGLPEALTGSLAFLLRIPDVVETRQKLEHLVHCLDQRAASSREGPTLSLNRLLGEAELLEMAIEQLAAQPRARMAAAASLGVQYMHEPGVGEGPVREFLDSMRQLFATTTTAASWGPIDPSSPLRLLPLFGPLAHQGDPDAIGPLPAPKPSTQATATATTAAAAPSSRQEEKGEDGGATAAAAVAAAAGSDDDNEEPGGVDRRTLYRVCGRLVGLALAHGLPLGVRFPPALWAALLQLRDPAAPTVAVSLPSTTATTTDDAAAVDHHQQRAAAVAPPRAGGGGGMAAGGQQRNRKTKKGGGGRNRRGGGGAEQGGKRGQGKEEEEGKVVVRVPVGRWEDYAGDDEVFRKSMRELLAADFTSPDCPYADLTFTATEEEQEKEADDSSSGSWVQRREVELVPGGAHVPVTQANVRAFVELLARRRVVRGAEAELCALMEGILDAVPDRLLRVFSPAELSQIVGGPRSLDLADLRRHVQYERGLRASHPTVLAFWEVVIHDFTDEERRLLLRFWSGSSSPPALGFGEMAEEEFAWTISKLTGPGVSSQSLPEASTCDRRLSIPEYESARQLRAKLRAAITHGSIGYDRV